MIDKKFDRPRLVRDEWENKKAEYEQRLSDLLGAPWKIDINLPQVCAYAQDGYAKESPGSMIASYVGYASFSFQKVS